MIDNMYCIKKCPLGKQKSKEFLNYNNSAYDAAIDMQLFVENCKTTCAYNKINEEVNSHESNSTT